MSWTRNNLFNDQDSTDSAFSTILGTLPKAHVLLLEVRLLVRQKLEEENLCINFQVFDIDGWCISPAPYST